ncbi:OB-fold domain-containing protein [Phyllobacterium sp. SB3]|uniref:Zn-ribbon domain-containing OB-fold protein n=1 Tax=Phyllobacterium sp. SB3 TaxID=3156073 RepID=UPI0032AEAC2F
MEFQSRPRSSPDTEAYWQGAREGRLLFQRCRSCGEPVFHPRPACPYCLSDKLAWEQSEGMGEIYSFTTQHLPLRQTEQAFEPRHLGIIGLDEGFHMFAEITGKAEGGLSVGRRVRVWFDDRGDGVTLPKFEVAS